MIDKKILKESISLSMPVFVVHAPLGVLFGVLFENLGYPWYLAPLISMLVYAGVVQFLMLTAFDGDTNLNELLTTCFFISLRNTFYTPVMFERFGRFSRYKQALLGFSLVDGTLGILLGNEKKSVTDDDRFCTYLQILCYVYWVVGSFVGAVFGKSIPDIKGLEFSLPLLFGLLAIDLYKKLDNHVPFTLSALCWLFFHIYSPRYALSGAIGVSFILLFLMELYVKYRNEQL